MFTQIKKQLGTYHLKKSNLFYFIFYNSIL